MSEQVSGVAVLDECGRRCARPESGVPAGIGQFDGRGVVGGQPGGRENSWWINLARQIGFEPMRGWLTTPPNTGRLLNICEFHLRLSLPSVVFWSFWGATKPPRETTGRPRQPSLAPVRPRRRDQLSLLGTT